LPNVLNFTVRWKYRIKQDYPQLSKTLEINGTNFTLLEVSTIWVIQIKLTIQQINLFDINQKLLKVNLIVLLAHQSNLNKVNTLFITHCLERLSYKSRLI